MAVWLVMTVTSAAWISIYHEIYNHSPYVLARVRALPDLPVNIINILGQVMAFSLGWLLIDQLDNSDPAFTPSYISVAIFVMMSVLAFSSNWILQKLYLSSILTENKIEIEIVNMRKEENLNSNSNPMLTVVDT